jgi:hypothetical protein
MCVVLLVYVVGFSCWSLEARGNLLELVIAPLITAPGAAVENFVWEKFTTTADMDALFFLTKNCPGL